MNQSTLNTAIAQFIDFWNHLKILQKVVFVAAPAILIAAIAFFTFSSISSQYVQLYSLDRMQQVDLAELRAYLDGAGIAYKMRNDNVILVPKDSEHKIRMELSTYGLPRHQTGKGYDIFDNTTWIKGEKELQIMELRALKGQLEQDIAQFENIRSANVVIDIPTQRPFGLPQGKTKASIILSLRPGARLSSQELRAITFHVSGAVRGLDPNMVAISDTTGKLYQSIDPDGELDLLRTAELAVEEHLKSKVDGMLTAIVGHDHYYTTVQVVMNRDKVYEERKVYSGSVEGVNLGNPVVQSITESTQQETNSSTPLAIFGKPFSQKGQDIDNRVEFSKQMAVPTNQMRIQQTPGKIESISLGVLIDQNAVPAASVARIRHDIENQLRILLRGYDVGIHESVDFIPFAAAPAVDSVMQFDETIVEGDHSSWKLLFIAMGLALLGVLIYQTMPKKTQEPQHEDQTPKRPLSDIETLLDTVRDTVFLHTKSKDPTDHETNTFLNLLEKGDNSELGTIFALQSPRLLALILLHLKPERSYSIIRHLALEKQNEILNQLDGFAQMDSDTQQSLLNTIKEDFGGIPAGNANDIAKEIRRLRDQDSFSGIVP